MLSAGLTISCSLLLASSLLPSSLRVRRERDKCRERRSFLNLPRDPSSIKSRFSKKLGALSPQPRNSRVSANMNSAGWRRRNRATGVLCHNVVLQSDNIESEK